MNQGLQSLIVALALYLVAPWPVQAAETTDAKAWARLSAHQRQVLAPLQKDWSGMDAARREKWLEVTSRFDSLPSEERARVKERMLEWARMSPSQRTRARLIYQETRQFPANERQARWNAYRSLSPEARQALAQRAAPAAQAASGVTLATPTLAQPRAKSNLVQAGPATPPKAVAPTVVQASPGATTKPMVSRATPPLHHQAGLPKIAAIPSFVDQATLLPRSGPQGAAARSDLARTPPSPQ